MLLIFTTFLLVLAGVSLAILLKRLSDNKLLDEDRPVSLAAESYRPLFAPTDEDLRLAEAEERKQSTTKQEEAKRQENEEKLAKLTEFRQTWSEAPNRAATIELLYRASQLEDGDAYLKTCDGVLAAWRDGKLADISAGDLAQLLETHFWLLPAEKRTPGASFRLKEAAAELKGHNPRVSG
jgi:hypothetical protein